MNRKLLIPPILMIGGFIWWKTAQRTNDVPANPADNNPVLAASVEKPPGAAHSSKPAKQKLLRSEKKHYEWPSNKKQNIPPAAFKRLRVKLPDPAPGYWEYLAGNSETNMASRNSKMSAIEHLPHWIRMGLRDNPEVVPTRLNSLITLTHDGMPEVSASAALGLYRLGDYQDVALKQIEKLIKSAPQYTRSASQGGTEDSVQVLNAVLGIQALIDELAYEGDHRLDNVIYQTWLQQWERDAKARRWVDFAAYLEKNVESLPEDYWAERARQPGQQAKEVGQELALEILRDRFGEKYQPFFDELYKQGNPWAAATLYQQTGGQKYADFLIQKVSTIANNPHPKYASELQMPLRELSRVLPEKVRDTVSPALSIPNSFAADYALDALKPDRSPEAAEAIFQAATNQFAQGNFSIPLINDLARRSYPEAQEKYEQLKREIIGKPRPAWQNQGPVYTERDFPPPPSSEN